MGELQKEFLGLIADMRLTGPSPAFHWMTNKLQPSSKAPYAQLWEVFMELGGYPSAMQTKQARRLPYDAFLPRFSCILEFDERQHFTLQRLQTLHHNYDNEPLGFDVLSYRELCMNYGPIINKGVASGLRKPTADFPFEGGRHAQRALFDMCRDLLPVHHGLAPTVRITEFEYSNILNASGGDPRLVKRQVQDLIEYRVR